MARDHPATQARELDGERRVTLAAVVGAHGIAGDVRLKLFTDDLAPYGLLDANGAVLTLKSVRPGPNGAVARFAEVASREAAEALRGTVLTVPRHALPALEDDEYYHSDLLDQPCYVGDAEIGRSVAIENYGAGDIVEIERDGGKRFMVPVPIAVTIESDRLVIDPAFVE